MSRLDRQFEALKELAQQDMWRLDELSGDLDATILGTLDAQDFIEFFLDRRHRETDSGTEREQDYCSRSGPPRHSFWFSPSRNPEIAGTIDELLMNPFRSSDSAKHYGARGPCISDNTQVRLTVVGRSELKRLLFEQNATRPDVQAHTPSQTVDKMESDIMEAVRKAGCRMKRDELLEKAIGKSTSQSRAAAAALVKRKVLTYRTDTDPQGYGLPEWD